MRKRKKRFLDIGYILTYNMYYNIYFKFCQINKKDSYKCNCPCVYMKGVYRQLPSCIEVMACKSKKHR